MSKLMVATSKQAAIKLGCGCYRNGKGHLVFFWNRNLSKKVKRAFPKNKVKTINYFGSKRRWNKEFIALFEYAKNLGANEAVDCFAGSGVLGLLAAKNGYGKVHLNDANPLVANYHRVMSDEDFTFNDFIVHLSTYDGYVKQNYYELCRELNKYIRGEETISRADAELAAKFYAVQHYGFDGQGGCSKKRAALENEVKALYDTYELYDNVRRITETSYKALVYRHLDKSNSLILLDPPYMPDTRKQDAYDVEFGVEQHREMLKTLTRTAGIAAKVMVCGYEHKMYDSYFRNKNLRINHEWHCIKLVKAGKRSSDAVAKERIWVNFDVDELVAAHSDMFELIY